MGKTPIARDCFLTNEDGSPFIGEKHPAMITLGSGQPVRNFVFGIGRHTSDQEHWVCLKQLCACDVDLTGRQAVRSIGLGLPYRLLSIYLILITTTTSQSRQETARKPCQD
jgi:hypothetical protein